MIKKMLTLDTARIAVKAMIDKALAMPGRPIAIAVTDQHGDLIAFACQSAANPALARRNALKKAFTCASMRADAETLAAGFSSQGGREQNFGNPERMMVSGGGLVIKGPNNEILGGIGVSGRPKADEDEAIAVAGRDAIASLLATN
ncbi:MAG TPA: heme-binding protein [Dehalococcoidia bacterium]|nr:heme-binding protein [Dehalococcoidia bacterium]